MEASINEAHPNDAAAEADDFFADDDETTHAEEPTAEEPTAEAEVTGDGSGEALPPVEEPEAPATVPATATAAGRAAAAAAQAAPPAEPPAATEPPADPPADPPAEEPQANKTKERAYKVFRELKLDEGTLTKLLEHVKSGADAIDVYLEVETVDARNDVHALKQVYASHRQQIGDAPRLVPVTARAWKPKTVQPRKRVEEALEIS